MNITLPAVYDYGFYNEYVSNVGDMDLITALEKGWAEMHGVFSALNEEQLAFRYEPGKWSIKEVMVHLIDGERNYNYRIFRISRGDRAQLPPVDMYQFAVSGADGRHTESILSELELLRKASILMFKDMTEDMLERTGPARGVDSISVAGLGFSMAGHSMHHMKIVKERYLSHHRI
jgi:hypothetical protein